ncbi:MAG: DUF1905 domain-containing protein [Acidobacteria bacterium]|nr:DUF1905 domain-containing protein [Acidobacteriota bacterium]
MGTFTAVIYRQGILRAVDVPEGIATEFADWEYPPVTVRAGGAERSTTLTPRREGGLRLFLHDELRKAVGVDTGDSIEVEIDLDESPLRPMPDEVMAAAIAMGGGLETVELLPPGLRRQMLDFVGSAKSEGTRRKRIARVIELIEERAAKGRQG